MRPFVVAAFALAACAIGLACEGVSASTSGQGGASGGAGTQAADGGATSTDANVGASTSATVSVGASTSATVSVGATTSATVSVGSSGTSGLECSVSATTGSCEEACTALYECGVLPSCQPSPLCSGLNDESVFVGTCSMDCKGDSNFRMSVDPANCAGTVSNLELIYPWFDTYCTQGPQGG